MKKLLIFLPLFFLLGCQNSSQRTEQALPFNPEIQQGVLNNGLKYYVQENGEPNDRVYIRLVVNAGSMNEDDDQKGVAHIVEHMAFNGSLKFPHNEIIAALEQLGMKFARDINAFTDFENTVYTLNIAKNDKKSLELALDVVNEWMNHLTILQEDLDAERGVVLEEWRARLSPMLRLGDKKSLVEMANSRYILRDPIGDVEVIKHVPRKRVQDFYRTWYRPDNMSLIVVGDIKKTQIVDLIEQKLATVNPQSRQPLPKIDFTIPLIKQWRVATVSEADIHTPSIELSFFDETNNADTVAAYAQELRQQIVLRLINVRLQEWENQQSAVVNSANFYHSHLGKETLQGVFSIQLMDRQYKQGINKLFEFIAQIQQQGFTDAELKDEITRLQRLNEKEVKIKVGSLKLANDLIPIAANNQVSLSPRHRYQLNKQLLAHINLSEINRTFRQMVNLPSKLLMITQPPGEKKLSLSADQIARQWQLALGNSQQIWQSDSAQMTMPELALANGDLQQTHYWKKANVNEYRLSNGSKLIYHYSDKSPGQVYFKAVTSGGLRSVPNNQYHLLRSAIAVVDDTGIGSLPQAGVNQLFTQNPIAFTTVVDDTRQGFTAAGKVEDMENLLKLFRLKLQSAPVSEQMLNKYKNESKDQFNQADKETEFMRAVSKLRFPEVETVYSRRQQDILSLRAEELSKIYQQYILDKTDFTYFIVGDISESAVQKLAKQYLASVPVKSQNRIAKTVNIHTPSKPFVLKGLSEPRADVEIYLNATQPWRAENEYFLDILGDVLQEKLRFSLREDASGVYFVNSWFNQDPHTSQIEGKIAFSCAPERVDELFRLTEHTLDQLMQQGIEPALLEKKLREKQMISKQQFESTLVVLGMLEQSFRLTDSPDLMYLYEQAEQIVTKEKFDALSRSILQKSGRFKAVLTQ
ncbi:zinc protease [Cricetibacter osteomyelitidis]|uniref:Zinc protease n=1 Tax=Cricetibacter osteomyelitidis TaxID=1521931 RepID=A0A4R2T3C7_9PAST|nr:insulinase family protein [Cricetibacter osteomyelitidis]TCP95736.1 zinc protease [Cricetibacter osteomyelitidis]